ncbi:MAG: hypothetical protein FWD76_01870 [Firmicutes bacterium]|nr:hypothetical protein [Bacillota bacterium]
MEYSTHASTVRINDALASNLNKLINAMTKAEFWHKRLANQCRLQDLRGWGRWHDVESDCASDTILCLEKIFADKLGFVPTLDFASLSQTQETLANADSFKMHFGVWEMLKQELIDVTNTVITTVAQVDMQIYKKACCMAERLQDDKTRVRMCKARLEKAEWGKHDTMICSMLIHKYFEHEHKSGDCYNINLG